MSAAAVPSPSRPPVAPGRVAERRKGAERSLVLVPKALDGCGRLSNRGSGRLDVRSDPETQCVRRALSAEYHAWALEVLRSFPFETPREVRVWDLHCDGYGAAAIDRILAREMRGDGWRKNPTGGRRRAPQGRNRRTLLMVRRLRAEAEAWMDIRNQLPVNPTDIAALEAQCDPDVVAQLHQLQERCGYDVEAMRAHLDEYPELAELLDHE